MIDQHTFEQVVHTFS